MQAGYDGITYAFKVGRIMARYDTVIVKCAVSIILSTI